MSNTKVVQAASLKVSLNTNSDTVKQVREALKENDGYCPCEIHQTPDTKCMCKAFREQKVPGPCHCGLYVKEVK
jgi:ferredoxin-thioredoxin reductase catalytic subunit